MNWFRHPGAVSKFWISACAALAMLIALTLIGSTARAQSSSGSLDGTVLDASGAIVPGANVTLKNQSSGDERQAVSNGAGFFSFAAVPPGTYTVRVERQGFVTWAAKDIPIGFGSAQYFGRGTRS